MILVVQRRQWPLNSIRFFREQKGRTLEEVAETIGTKHQTIQKLEKGEMALTPKWARQIGDALGIHWEDLGFPSTQDYPWATRPVPVIGDVIQDLEVKFLEHPRRQTASITVVDPDVADVAALDIASGALPNLGGWLLFFDRNRRRMTAEIVQQQRGSISFISELSNGSMWWKMIAPSTRRNIWHLGEMGVRPMHDVEIVGVYKVFAAQPGRDLPQLETNNSNGPCPT
jgi:DNA-binding XRE family transcriptional regulator